MFDRERTEISSLAASLHRSLRNNQHLLFRFTLGTVFLWFGALKVIGESSVLSIIQSSYPFLAHAPFLQFLGLGEMVLGIGVLLGWHVRVFAGLMVLHLLGTLLVPLIAPVTAFDPGFPVLTLQGEFVVKNLVLLSAALLIAVNSNTDRLQ